MALNYIYIKYKDIHTLTNNESMDMNYEVVKNSCDASSVLSTGVIIPGSTVTINFITDGNYTIKLKVENEEASFTIKYFQNLLKSFITSAEKLLCGCSKCDDCEDCNECQDYLGAFMKAFSINSLNYPLYQTYVNLISQNTVCEFTDQVICTLINEKVFGSSSVKEPMLKILSYYYAAFYYRDFYMASDVEEASYITTKYKFDKIAKCMRKLGVDPAEVIQGRMVYFWQLDNIDDTITEVISELSPNYIETKANLPLATFEAGHIVNYSQVGRICFIVMPTQVQNFTISDSLNNDVTDEFDTYYDNNLNLVLFVSKIVYAPSNIYFKFKKFI